MNKNTAIGDFNVSKEAANQFYYVARLCADRDAIDYMANTFYPYSVNIAFACELYIKSIMIYRSNNSEFTKGHDLKQLFESLDNHDIRIITKEFENKYSKITLEKFLDENKNIFVEWRYALEKGVAINLTGFEIFVEILKEYVQNLGEKA